MSTVEYALAHIPASEGLRAATQVSALEAALEYLDRAQAHGEKMLKNASNSRELALAQGILRAILDVRMAAIVEWS